LEILQIGRMVLMGNEERRSK